MKSYLYILGRTPELAFSELTTFLPDAELLVPAVAASNELVPIGQLGGTVKIAKVVGSIPSMSADSLSPFVERGVTFGVSVYDGGTVDRIMLEDIKKRANAARFIESRDGNELSSVVVEKKHVYDLVVAKGIVAHTIQVQPFEEWSKRDFGRPFADPRAGMLPPKVARMAVNIAGIGKGKTLLDPFCGMGTILAEAAVVGWSVIGSDQSDVVVEKARKNLTWLGVTNAKIFTSDATHISDHLGLKSVDAIVTEPFLGKAHTAHEKPNIKNTIKGLEKLYIGCLRDWHAILKDGGTIVIALPQYNVGGRVFFVKKVIDMCENLGYTIQTGPIEYGRPQATVKRLFYKFQKSNIWPT